jgi:hypothetical protein
MFVVGVVVEMDFTTRSSGGDGDGCKGTSMRTTKGGYM